ncbi:MAG: HD domain-containing protein [Planctomycetota bacterium]
MDINRLRREICFEAARLLSARRESSYTHAKWRAARSITSSYIPPEALPTDFEIRQSLQDLVAADGESRAIDDPVPENRRFHYFLSLLLPLDRVLQDRETHPEGDVLYHSLQVFELAREQRPWDEEFLLAALLHDVGKGIDPFDHVAAGLLVLDGYISDRTRWLIENHGLAQRVRDGVAGARSRRRLTNAEDGDALDLLASCDREGRLPGRHVCSAEEAIEYIRQLEEDNESWDEDDTGGD